MDEYHGIRKALLFPTPDGDMKRYIAMKGMEIENYSRLDIGNTTFDRNDNTRIGKDRKGTWRKDHTSSWKGRKVSHHLKTTVNSSIEVKGEKDIRLSITKHPLITIA